MPINPFASLAREHAAGKAHMSHREFLEYEARNGALLSEPKRTTKVAPRTPVATAAQLASYEAQRAREAKLVRGILRGDPLPASEIAR